MHSKDQSFRGIALRVLSGLFFAIMIICVKLTSGEVPLGEIVFFRSAFALIPLIAFLWMRGEFPNGLRTNHPRRHIARSVFGSIAMFCSFAAIARLSVAEATLIAYLAPVVLVVAAVAVLGERLTIYRVGGLLLGFAGVAALVWPELSLEQANAQRLIGIGLGVISALFAATALIVTRVLTRTDTAGGIAFWFSIASAAAGLATLPSGWVLPGPEVFALLIAAGFFGGMAQISMTTAFRYAEASRLAPFEYIALIWLVFADLFVFQIPMSSAFFVALILVIGGASVAAMERNRAT